uniref:Uncharacterized protein n=1 Tax=Avena sativa TaxID=4498 RepID=A0ACD5TLZ4_AVESA
MAPGPAASLPEDVLAEILRRLAPLVLAASRRVCRAWRDTVDGRLRRHLISHSVRGIFINYTAHRHGFSEFLSRPSTGPSICGELDFLPCDGVKVADHCNGLLLCGDRKREYVVNPATRRWARLPRRPPPHMLGFGQSAYLAFEPAVSPHYEVFVIPRLPSAGELVEDDELDKDTLLESEWPPASYALHVFSSMEDRWEEKTFLREGEAAGVVVDMVSNLPYYQYHAVYWRSALYIHGQHGCLTKMSLTNHTYSVIRLPVPGDDDLRGYPTHHLGRSLRGVYCAQGDYRNRLQIWHLDESRDQMEWVLKHDIRLDTCARKFTKIFEEDHAKQMGGPWILQDVNYRKDCERYQRAQRQQMDGSWILQAQGDDYPHWYFEGYRNRDKAPPVEEKYDWNSDEDSVLDIEDAAEGRYSKCYQFLGFHPYKEIVYLEFSRKRGVAYNWNSSKFQNLGSLEAEQYFYHEKRGIDSSFPYTPCWMGQFPGNELESLLEDEEIARIKRDQLEDSSNFTCLEEYELCKHRGSAKMAKDSTAKIRRRRRVTARAR